ncbi:hypothetical protein FTX61_06750 [Nitriliruptoraceae bacterium ZYF776]|nr:hypothetical protein [Profundirhabdus halotolerans]
MVTVGPPRSGPARTCAALDPAGFDGTAPAPCGPVAPRRRLRPCRTPEARTVTGPGLRVTFRRGASRPG